jgi:cadmium resistance protein CadD (predicted permease)
VIFLAGLAMFAATNIDGLFLTAALLADRSFRARDVLIGTYAGIAALYAASAAGSLVSLVAPAAVIAALGLVPIAIGIRQLKKGQADAPVKVKSAGLLAVAGLNIAMGADNVGVYTPVFAASAAADIAAYGAIFAVLTGLWCYAAYRLVHHPSVGAPVRRYAPRLVPFVLIGLGLWILAGRL